jgi:HlyD family secretion protein
MAACAEQNSTGYQGWVEADLIFVSPDEAGRVTRLTVREGDPITAGAALYGLDDDLQKADLNQQMATLANAQQTFDEARVNTSQTRRARRSGNAPVAGTVHQIYFREGEMVPMQRPVLSILPPGNMKVRFFVSETELPKLVIGQDVRVTCDGCAEDLTAKIYYIATTAEYTPPVIYSQDERHKLVYLVQARPNKPDQLRVGQPVSVTLKDAAAPAVAASDAKK